MRDSLNYLLTLKGNSKIELKESKNIIILESRKDVDEFLKLMQNKT